MEKRVAEVTRKTQETDIKVKLNLDGTGTSNITTGIGFFDHMLQGFTKHGFYDMDVTVNGDLNVDGHHTVEDTGIVLGQAISKALGDKKGIKRYGSMILPMDETLVMCAIDCKRIFLCSFLFCSYEPTHKSIKRIQRSPQDRGNIQGFCKGTG